jgi:hypothetical protein
MTDYRVVCIERSAGGVGHITAVGTGTQTKADKHWTVSQVRTAIKNGDTFHTVSPSTSAKAYIEPFDIPGLRTKGDKSKDDNLEHLRACKFSR